MIELNCCAPILRSEISGIAPARPQSRAARAGEEMHSSPARAQAWRPTCLHDLDNLLATREAAAGLRPK
jgi:hypothetical protein